MIEKFIHVKNFISKDEVDLLKIWSEIMHRKNTNSFDDGLIATNRDTYFYGTPITDALLVKSNSLVNEKTSLNLIPTYSFGRIYTKFATLKKHTDRPSCEISVTIQVGSDGTPWPIFMGGEKVLLEDGDGVIYKGREVPHWRDEFEGDWHSQIFLHYVEKDGKYKDHFMDKRELFGLGNAI